MAILRIEELEAYIRWLYKQDPTSQYSTKVLTKHLRLLNVNNPPEDIYLLHESLFEPTVQGEKDVPLISDIEEEIDLRNFNPNLVLDNTKLLAQLYGEGLDEFYNDQAFR